jgi:hypothetical protein
MRTNKVKTFNIITKTKDLIKIISMLDINIKQSQAHFKSLDKSFVRQYALMHFICLQQCKTLITVQTYKLTSYLLILKCKPHQTLRYL